MLNKVSGSEIRKGLCINLWLDEKTRGKLVLLVFLSPFLSFFLFSRIYLYVIYIYIPRVSFLLYFIKLFIFHYFAFREKNWLQTRAIYLRFDSDSESTRYFLVFFDSEVQNVALCERKEVKVRTRGGNVGERVEKNEDGCSDRDVL